MILIISNGTAEPTTDMVIDWLIKQEVKFFRINTDDLYSYNSDNLYSYADNKLVINGQIIDVSTVNVIWYRRWYDYEALPVKPKNQVERQLRHELISEVNNFLYFLQHLFNGKEWLCNPIANITHNKLHTLKAAKESGLRVPETIVTNSKNELIRFRKKCGEVITKPIADPGIYIDSEGNGFKSYTDVLTDQIIRKLPENFYLSLFQEKMESEYEIRSFFLDGDIFSTAILNSETIDIKLSVRTQVDMVMSSYNLPESIKEKVRLTMKQVGLNTGSFDMIRNKDGEYCFLEVNPVGQFTGYGQPCNYHLEKRVADWLIKKDNIRSNKA